MRQFILVLLLIATSNYSYAQDKSGMVLNVENVTAIPYALITNIDRSFGVSSDSSGVFSIPPPELEQAKKWIVSAIGFRADTFQVSHSEWVFKLKKQVTTSAPTEFTKLKKPNKPIAIGITSQGASLRYGMPPNSNTELALFIENPKNKTGQLTGFNLFIGNYGVLKTPCRVRLYQNQLGIPFTEITTKNVIIFPYALYQWNHFDLSEMGLEFPKEGCFVSIEWLNMNNPEHVYDLRKSGGSAVGIGPSILLDSETIAHPLLFGRSNEGLWEKRNKLVWNRFHLNGYSPNIHINVVF